jgi:CBS domain-containing protein
MQIVALGELTAARLSMVAIDAPLRTAAIALSSPRIGILVACYEDKKAAGVVSKSDIIRFLARDGVADASVGELMSPTIIACNPEDDLYEAWQRMSARKIQNMPVVTDKGRVVGVLDIRDALKALFEQEEYQEHLLSNYVAGVGYQ